MVLKAASFCGNFQNLCENHKLVFFKTRANYVKVIFCCFCSISSGLRVRISFYFPGIHPVEKFISDGVCSQQFWDSNDGKNYRLVNKQEPVIGTAPRRMPLFGKPDKTDVYVYGSYDNWSRFASWKDVSSEAPYW